MRAVNAELKDIDKVQIHPTGLVHPDEPDNKVKFLAAEALRGVGGIMLDCDGRRFVNELGRRDYVSETMCKHDRAPYRLVLNGKASKEIEWHCKHYCGRKLMKQLQSGEALAKEMQIQPQQLEQTFKEFNMSMETKRDPYGREYFQNGPWTMDDIFHVAIITPVRHYCMGGLHVNTECQVLSKQGPIPGLYCSGEIMGGTHGANRLGGSSLLDCVVFGRIAGLSSCRYLMEVFVSRAAGGALLGAGASATDGTVHQGTVDVPQDSTNAEVSTQTGEKDTSHSEVKRHVFTLSDVAKHNREDDCWVVVNGEVLNVSSFLNEHPGGKQAILLFAGRDATEEFNMLHKPDVVSKYCPECIVGVLDNVSSSKASLAKMHL
uniref:Putative fumarate reductase n=1 Tax=Lygus hesperus TaxID=30085 RepID=A0A146LJV0_LYGHE